MANGTGPLSSRPSFEFPIQSPRRSPPSPQPSPSTQVATPNQALQSQNQTGIYQSHPQTTPNQMAFEIPPVSERLQALLPYLNKPGAQALACPPEKLAGFNALAQELGFGRFEQMKHQLRHLPPSAWIQLAGALRNQPELSAKSAQALLHQIALGEIEKLFQQANMPPPIFEAQGNSTWSPQASLSVYNAFAEITASQGVQMLQRLGQNANGTPLTFTRTDKIHLHSFKGADNQLSLIEALSGAMMVAHRDEALGKIVLRDGAVSMSPADVLNHPEINDFLDRIQGSKGSPQEQRQAIQSLREMLNYSLPAQRKLPVSGQKNQALKQAVHEFQLQQVLKNALDIIKDNPALNTQQEASPLNQLLRLQTQIRTDGPTPALKTALKKTLEQLKNQQGSDATAKSRLQELHRTFDNQTQGEFNRQTLNFVVENWFNILDSGQQFDFTEQVVTHELGHVLQMEPEILNNWRQISWREESAPPCDTATMGETLKTHDDHGFASDYARVNDEEDFAESYRLFTQHPEDLLKKSLMKFLFMSALTGAYDGKETEMAKIIQANGYSKFDLEVALLEIRGHIKTASHNNVQSIIDKTVAMSKAASPLIGLALEKLESYFELKDKIADWWVDLRGYNDTAQFTPKIASAFKGMDQVLGIDCHSFQNMPAQPGFVLDFLSQNQAILENPRSTPAQKTKAEQNLKSFEREGINIFPPKIRSQLAPEVGQALTGSEGQSQRQVLLALSQILGHAKAQVIQERNAEPGMLSRLKSFVLNESETKPPSYFDSVKANPALLRQAIDPKLYAKLPEAFQAMLEDGAFIHEITLGGESSINANNIHSYTFSEIERRSHQTTWDSVKKSFEGIWDLLSWDMIPLPKAYAQYRENVENYNQGVTDKLPVLSLNDFEKAIQEVRAPSDKASGLVLPTSPSSDQNDLSEQGDLKRFIRALHFDTPA